jgi:hypothetical protein
MRQVIMEMYTEASSTLEIDGERTTPITWGKGVKQGCPLSPLLFNLCLEPLIQGVKQEHATVGAYAKRDREHVGFTIQAYADDIVLISERPEGVQAMLQTLKLFTEWSQMKVNVSKCVTASYMIDERHIRGSLDRLLQFGEEEIPNLSLTESMKYLGTAVTKRMKPKFKSAEATFNEAHILVKKIMQSPLLTVQKVDAVKTFVLPKFDFLLLNGQARVADLTTLDKFIRMSFDKQLRVNRLPVACHHASWRDGAMSYPSLRDRADVLKVRSFTHMLLSEDESVRRTMDIFIEQERILRKIGQDDQGSFLDWADENVVRGEQEMEGEDSQEAAIVRTETRHGTDCITARTRKACQKLGIRLKVDGNKVIVSKDKWSSKVKMAKGMGRILTQRVIRQKWVNELRQLCSGDVYEVMENDSVGNSVLKTNCSRKSNALYRFVIAARADYLATPNNINKWYNRDRDPCRRCNQERMPTLAHILNECAPNFAMMTERHNRVSNVVRDVIQKKQERVLLSPIHENKAIRLDGLPGEVAGLRPDLWFVRKDECKTIWELIEFSCPFPRVDDDGVSSLEAVYQQKKEKYEGLRCIEDISYPDKVRITPVIVSSLGTVYQQSLKDLQAVLKCSRSMIRRVGRRLSMTSIFGSMALWREFVKQMPHGRQRAEDGGAEHAAQVVDGGIGGDDLDEIRDEEVATDEMERELSGSEEELEGEAREQDTDDNEVQGRMTTDNRGLSQQDPFEASQEEEEENFERRIVEAFIPMQPVTHSGCKRARLKKGERNRRRTIFSGEESNQSDKDEGDRPRNLVRSILSMRAEGST